MHVKSFEHRLRAEHDALMHATSRTSRRTLLASTTVLGSLRLCKESPLSRLRAQSVVLAQAVAQSFCTTNAFTKTCVSLELPQHAEIKN